MMMQFIKRLLCRHAYRMTDVGRRTYYHDDAHNLITEVTTVYECPKCGKMQKVIEESVRL